MGTSAWSNPGPAKRVIIAGPGGELLVYSPTPGAGNLIAAIAASAGSDQYGNSFNAGVSIIENAVTGASGQMSFYRSDSGIVQAQLGIIINAGVNEFLLNSNYKTFINTSSDLVIYSTGNGMRFGQNAALGKYFYEEVFLPATSIPNNAVTTLTGLTAGSNLGDYVSGWNLATGTWTCPVAGQYKICFSHAYTSWVANSRQNAIILRNGVGIGGFDDTNGHAAAALSPTSCFAYREFAANDTVQVQVLQNTGVAQTLRVFDGSYISIGRDL